MKRFDIPTARRLAALPINRKFQAAVCLRANELMLERHGETKARVAGIYKYEGGVVVNGFEIAIKKSWVADDWRKSGEYPEEDATVDALMEVIERVNNGDTLEDAPEIEGDPLRSFFEEAMEESES